MTSLLRFARSPATQSYTRLVEDFRVDGQLRSLGALRSDFTRSSAQWVTTLLNEPVMNHDPAQLGMAALLGTAFLAITARASFAAEIPLRVVDERGQVVTDSPAQAIVDRAARFLWRAVAWQVIVGSTYYRKRWNPYHYPSDLELLNSIDVRPNVDYGTNTVRSYWMTIGARQVEFPACDIIADHVFHPLSDIDGASALESAMLRVDTEVNAARFASAFFANSARPDLVITTDTPMTAEQQKEAKKTWQLNFKGVANAFRAAFLGGAKWVITPLTANPVDLAMPELTNQADVKICAALHVNPILVGLGQVSDPLSAQNTYQAVRQDHLEHVAIPDARAFCQVLNEQWLWLDFADRAGRWTLEPDIAGIQSGARATGDRITTAVTASTGRVWTVNEARDYTGKEALAGVLQVNPDWATTAFQAGGLTLGEYRAALGGGYKPYKVDGLVWELDPRAKGQPTSAINMAWPPGNQPPPALPPSEPPKALGSGTSEPAATPPAMTVAPTGAPARAIASTEAIYVLLSFADNPTLTEAQTTLKGLMVDPAIEWTDPADFHVTLVYAPQANDLKAIKTVLPQSINAFTLDTGALDTFDKPDKVSVILHVKPTPALIALQAGLVGAFTALGLSLSAYSDPAAWQPHITLGYAAPGVELPTWDKPLTLTSATLKCSVEADGGQYETIVVTRAKAVIAAQLNELAAWAKWEKGHGRTRRPFHPDLTPDALTTWIRSQLTAAWPVSAVFAAAKAAIRDGEPPTIGATPEEYTAYWQGYDQLDADLGKAFLDYMAAVGDPLLAAVTANPDSDPTAILDRGHDALLSAWIGTLDQPGPLLAILLAGLASGDQALQRDTTANPHAPTRAVAGVLNWALMSQQSVDFARQYAFDLIKEIDQTTVDKVRATVAQSVTEGWAGDQLRDALAAFINPLFPGQSVEQRAATIGDTESIRAFNAGAFQRWEDAGVTRAVWLTVNDGSVCDLCRRLHGQVADFRTGWTDPATGKVYREIAHVLCRCPKKPSM